MFVALRGQYKASNASIDNVDINTKSLFLENIRDSREYIIINAIIAQMSRLLMVIQY